MVEGLDRLGGCSAVVTVVGWVKKPAKAMSGYNTGCIPGRRMHGCVAEAQPPVGGGEGSLGPRLGGEWASAAGF